MSVTYFGFDNVMQQSDIQMQDYISTLHNQNTSTKSSQIYIYELELQAQGDNNRVSEESSWDRLHPRHVKAGEGVGAVMRAAAERRLYCKCQEDSKPSTCSRVDNWNTCFGDI